MLSDDVGDSDELLDDLWNGGEKGDMRKVSAEDVKGWKGNDGRKDEQRTREARRSSPVKVRKRRKQGQCLCTKNAYCDEMGDIFNGRRLEMEARRKGREKVSSGSTVELTNERQSYVVQNSLCISSAGAG